jgi:hypothetical protein
MAITRGSARSQWPAPKTLQPAAPRSPWPRWRRRPGPGRRRGDVGVVGPVDHEEGPPLQELGVLGGWRTESSLAQASAEAGNPGVESPRSARTAPPAPRDHPGQGPRSAGVPRQATPATRSSPAARCRPGHRRIRSPPTSAGRLGAPRSRSRTQVVQPALGREVAAGLPGAPQRPGDHAPGRFAGEPIGQGRVGLGHVAAEPLARGRSWQRPHGRGPARPEAWSWRRSTGRPPARAGAGRAPSPKCRCAVPGARGGRRDRRAAAPTTWPA